MLITEVSNPDQLLKEHDAADLICQSVRTLQKWRVTGAGPQFFKIGRSVRYRRGDVIDWVNKHRRTHTTS